MRISVLLVLFVIALPINADEPVVNGQVTDATTRPEMTPIEAGVTVNQAMRLVVSAMENAFPGAYKQFLSVEMEYSENGTTHPEKAEFYVPARFFESPIDEEQFQARAKRMAYDIGGTNGCTDAELGEVEQLGWLNWPDKTVRKVTINFYFYC